MNPNKKQKVQNLLNKLIELDPDTVNEFSEFDEGLSSLAEKLRDRVRTKLKNNVETNKFVSVVNELRRTLSASQKELKDLVLEFGRLTHERIGTVQNSVKAETQTRDISLKSLTEKTTELRGDIRRVENQIRDTIREIEKNLLTLENASAFEKEAGDAAFSALKKEFEDSQRDTRSQLASISSQMKGRGGNANRDIVVDGSDVLDYYTDLNLVSGTGVTIAATNNHTTKRTTLTFTASGFAPQAPTSGAINGSNLIFVFTAAPSVICVDQGRFMQRVSSDSTVNWTVVGATVTLTVAPVFDIFGL